MGYPVNYISNAAIPGVGGIPKVVIFLTADAFGVLPPHLQAKPDAAMYHFVTGFTSKLAGTERGITEPKPTFLHPFWRALYAYGPGGLRQHAGRKDCQVRHLCVSGEHWLGRWPAQELGRPAG